MTTSSNKRIAKNTVYLYFRMLLLLGVSLYTSRVILEVLGAEDYGLYNVVGGVVVMMSFLNGAFAAATSRFLTFDVGCNNKVQLARTFAATLNLHIVVALVAVILGETVGLWFFYHKMVIPVERMDAAFWVYQISIVATVVSFVQIPYNAILIANEKMSVYAFVAIYEAITKLLIVYFIGLYAYDKLIIYAFLLCGNSILIQLFYKRYISKRHSECRWKLFMDGKLYKKLLSYSGWDMFGGVALICQGEGINILLNLFFGPIVNAARAISFQIQSGVSQFTSLFLMAVRPQIIRNYAEGNTDEMYRLTFYASKFGYMLMFAFVVPICFEIDFILKLWLGDKVPEYTNVFSVIILISSLFQSVNSAQLSAYHAIGRIKTGNIVGGTLMILVLPISYLCLRMGLHPQIVFIVTLIVNLIVQLIGLLLIRSYVFFSLRIYMKEVVGPCFLVSIIGLIFPLLISFLLPDGWVRFSVLLVVAELVILTSILYLGFSLSERTKLFILIKNKIRHV